MPDPAKKSPSRKSPSRSRKSGSAPRKKDAAKVLEDLEVVFDALAHEQRRHILLVLHYRGGQMLAGDIAGRFACSWPTTTRHLGVLRDAGLVEVSQDGRHRTYHLNRDRLQSVVGDWLGNFAPPSTTRSKRRTKS